MDNISNKKIYISFFSIYFFAGIFTSIWQLYSSNLIFSYTQNTRYSYFWMDYKFSFIQTPNNMLLFGSFIACCFGSLLKSKRLCKKTIEELLVINLFNLLICVFASSICLFIINKYNATEVDFNIIASSVSAFVSFYLYIVFWSLLAYGFRLTFGKKIVSIILLFLLQMLELFVIPAYGLFDLLKYLPTTLSRELVIQQFPFWIEGTWVNNLKVFSYANVSPTKESILMKENLSLFWIYSFLVIYLILALILPITRKIKARKHENIIQFDNN